MIFRTLEELEDATLTPIQVKECFKFLIKLIIHNETNEARDYTFALAQAVLRTMQEEKEEKF